jgi:REP-associated tyrosine transposase
MSFANRPTILATTDLMVENCEKFGVLVRSHAWMPNHVHLVAVPLQPDSFAKAFRRAHSMYARWFNRKYGLSGYLWQDRFFSCPLDEDHFWAAMRYVERNPVRAGLVARAEDYPWSSAAFHSFGRPNALKQFGRILHAQKRGPKARQSDVSGIQLDLLG